jgi:uncharacterized protein affecting Mg2+/Co2+ transport
LILFYLFTESEELWQLLLQRDFGFTQDTEDWKKTLAIEEFSSSVASIFGVDPARADAIIDVSCAFDSWKGWKKASSRFYRTRESPILLENRRGRPSQQLVHAPYFLRAAMLWQTIFRWCDNPDVSKTVGPILQASLNEQSGMYQTDWLHLQQNGSCTKGLDACRAVYAFTGGQGHELDRQTAFDGLLGGYEAYGYYSCTHLITPQVLPDRTDMVIVAVDLLSGHQGLPKLFMLDGNTGTLDFRTHLLESRSHSIRALNHRTPQPDDFLVWLEEYGRRLSDGRIGVGSMGPHLNDEAITLYPQFPRSASPTITEGVSPVGRAVTRGVEVVASGVYVPQARNRFGYIYSIRVRLLTPGEEGYLNATQRGFETCQLQSRHWQITDDSSEQTDRVDGEGVIGMYPLLREGGYTEDGEDFDGILQYQSCTGGMSHGSFRGHMQFIPGSRNAPTGPPFAVELKPFELNKQPTFLY